MLAEEACRTLTVRVAIVLLAVADIALGQDVSAVNVDQLATLGFNLGEAIVHVHRFHRDPVLLDTFTNTIISHVPLALEVIRLAFGPFLPVLLVEIAIIADAAQAL